MAGGTQSGSVRTDDAITGLFPGHLLEGRREVPGIAVEEGSFVCSVSFGLNERIDERL